MAHDRFVFFHQFGMAYADWCNLSLPWADSAIRTIAYGAIADHSNRTVGLLAAAATAALIIPMVLGVRSSLAKGQ
jgi:hypothetical protein